MTTATIPKCKCGAEMYAGPSGWVCSCCDAPIKPYMGRKPPKDAKRIEHDSDEHKEEVCDKCNGTGKIDCIHCDGDSYTICKHCGQDVNCKECHGRGKVPCPVCTKKGKP